MRQPCDAKGTQVPLASRAICLAFPIQLFGRKAGTGARSYGELASNAGLPAVGSAGVPSPFLRATRSEAGAAAKPLERNLVVLNWHLSADTVDLVEVDVRNGKP